MEQEIEEIVSNDGVAAERQRVREITTLGKRHNQKDMAAQADENGVLLEQFRTNLLDNLGRTKPLDIEFIRHHDQYAATNFLLLKAIRAAVVNDWREADLEREVISETQRQSEVKARGVLVPSAMFTTRSVLNAGAVSGLGDGSQIVATDHLADRFVDILRNETEGGVALVPHSLAAWTVTSAFRKRRLVLRRRG